MQTAHVGAVRRGPRVQVAAHFPLVIDAQADRRGPQPRQLLPGEGEVQAENLGTDRGTAGESG